MATGKPSAKQRLSLLQTARKYHGSLSGSPAEEYLASRGLQGEPISEFALGYVAEPEPGHEAYHGMLAIPYLRFSARNKVSVADIRFRCIRDGCEHQGHGKYMSLAGSTPKLYNTAALAAPDTVAVCEGEIDAITATIGGIPAVGAPGASSWQDHFSELFDQYTSVYILSDGDKAGREFAKVVIGKLRNGNGEVREARERSDVNSDFLALGAEAWKARVLGG